MRYTLISQFTGQVLKLNPGSEPPEAISPLYLTELLCHSGRTETGHWNWNLWHHSFSVCTEGWIFHSGTGVGLVLHWTCGTLWYAVWETSLCLWEMALWAEKGVVWKMRPVWSTQTMACCLMMQAVNPYNSSVHCSFLSCRVLASDNSAFMGEKVQPISHMLHNLKASLIWEQGYLLALLLFISFSVFNEVRYQPKRQPPR